LSRIPIENRTAELRRIAVWLRRETDTEFRRTHRERRLHLAHEVEGVISQAYGLDPAVLAAATDGS
jgi:uncharacterized protein YehS (DUF1456 family)